MAARPGGGDRAAGGAGATGGRGTPSRGLPDRHAGRFALPGLRRLPRRVTVRGPSMMPTLREGDVVLALPGARVRPGSVALVRWAARPGQLSVKRLESRTAEGLWVTRGDNARASTDSRDLGPASALAAVPFRLWPRPGRLAAAPADRDTPPGDPGPDRPG